MLVQFQIGTPFSYWIITGVVESDLGLFYIDGKLRHRTKTFMRVQDLILPFSSSNLSNNGEVGTCPAAQTLFGFHLISSVLEVQMSSGFFYWKAKTISHRFHGTKGSNSDVSNDVLASQQYQ